MKKFLFRLLFFAIFTSNLTACGTIVSIVQDDYSVYGGVTRDFRAIQDGGVKSVFGVIDLPLSFVLDTLMLPVTLSK